MRLLSEATASPVFFMWPGKVLCVQDRGPGSTWSTPGPETSRATPKDGGAGSWFLGAENSAWCRDRSRLEVTGSGGRAG